MIVGVNVLDLEFVALSEVLFKSQCRRQCQLNTVRELDCCHQPFANALFLRYAQIADAESYDSHLLGPRYSLSQGLPVCLWYCSILCTSGTSVRLRKIHGKLATQQTSHLAIGNYE